MKNVVYKGSVKIFLSHTGLVARANQFKAFKGYCNYHPNTHFVEVFKLLRNICGVYRFNSGNEVLYIGYSENLQERICISFFNHCIGYDNITMQLILCEDKQQALEIELYYIKQLAPLWNISIGNKNINSPNYILPFGGEIYINSEFFKRFCE